MEKWKHKWWLLVPILLIAVILAGVFRDAILIRIAPEAVLTSALSQMFSQLEERFQQDPLLILARAFDPDGKYTADMKLETERDIWGSITYDMTVQTDGVSHQLLANGTAKTSAKSLNLSLYMDADFMAVSSQELVRGNYYGLTYDTFAADIRKIPLLNLVVSDSLLAEWEGSVQGIQEKMSRTYALPRLPEISREDMQALLLGVATLKGKIEKCSVLLDDEAVTCYKLDYSASGKQIGDILSEITDDEYSENAVVTVSFYLYRNTVIKIMLACEEGESGIFYSFQPGLNPAEDRLTLQNIESKEGEYEDFLIAVTTQRSENIYTETWNVYSTADGVDSNRTFSYDWYPASGDMVLRTGTSSESLSLNLTQTENGFRVVTGDFAQLMRMVTQDTQSTASDNKISCAMTVSKGSGIKTPAYKNLDQWSMEDFLVLLGGIGTLIGINVG